MNYDLVDMIDNQFNLTKLGKDAYESIRIIDNAIKLEQTFDTTNIFELWKMKGTNELVSSFYSFRNNFDYSSCG